MQKKMQQSNNLCNTTLQGKVLCIVQMKNLNMQKYKKFWILIYDLMNWNTFTDE
jgi:hypothetical protein